MTYGGALVRRPIVAPERVFLQWVNNLMCYLSYDI